MEQGWICRQDMKESRVWWEESGAGLDMQRAEGEQGVVGRVWSRAGYAESRRRTRCGRKSVEQGWICRQGMKESRVWGEECGAGQTGYEGEQAVVGRVWSRAGYADRV